MNALRLIFAVLLAGGAAFVLTTSASLPAQVASHFDGNGYPNSWMTREGYQWFMLLFVCGLPLLMVWAIGALPRRFPHLTNLPHRAHWLAHGERERTLAYLSRHALVLGCILVVFGLSIHWLVVMANRQVPPRLEHAPFFAMLAAFLIALAIWGVMLYLRFRRPR